MAESKKRDGLTSAEISRPDRPRLLLLGEGSDGTTHHMPFTAANLARALGVPVPHIPGDTTTSAAPEAIQIGPTDIS